MVVKKRKRKKRSHNGAIRLLDNGKYFARVALGYTGKRYIYKSITGNSKADVQNLISVEKRKYRSWNITEESMMTLSSWLSYWLDEIKKQGQERINEYMMCWNAMVKNLKKRPSVDEYSWFLNPKKN